MVSLYQRCVCTNIILVPTIFWYQLSWLIIAIRMLLPQDDLKRTRLTQETPSTSDGTTTQMLMYQPFVQSS
jgi:hypothetical protein